MPCVARALTRGLWATAGPQPEGLTELMRRATPGSVIELACDIVEGFMHEQLHSFDLRLPADVTPINQDGEVAELRCLPVDEAIDLAAGGAMTMDASLVTLDFALRHRLLVSHDHARLAALMPQAQAEPAR